MEWLNVDTPRQQAALLPVCSIVFFFMIFNLIAHLRNFNIFKTERIQEKNVFLLWGLRISKRKAWLSCQRKMFLSYFSFMITRGWEDGRNPVCFFLSYFLFYTFVLNAVIEFRGQEREALIWRSQPGSFGGVSFVLSSVSTRLDWGVLLRRPQDGGL